jgi:hypothetical protein
MILISPSLLETWSLLDSFYHDHHSTVTLIRSERPHSDPQTQTTMTHEVSSHTLQILLGESDFVQELAPYHESYPRVKSYQTGASSSRLVGSRTLDMGGTVCHSLVMVAVADKERYCLLTDRWPKDIFANNPLRRFTTDNFKPSRKFSVIVDPHNSSVGPTGLRTGTVNQRSLRTVIFTYQWRHYKYAIS